VTAGAKATALAARSDQAVSRSDAGAVLLDTHAWVWLLQGTPRLGPKSRAAVEAACRYQAGVLIAAISVWEVGMLVAKGRLVLDRDVGEWVRMALALPGVTLIGLEPDIAVSSTRLPGDLQGDPADRLIVASARHVGAVLITDDGSTLEYAAQGHVRALRASS
jgi:PIN domain nuclease of toxin-antitoxin system